MIGASLGHTQPQMTARYAHLGDAALREATEGISALVSEVDNGSVVVRAPKGSNLKAP